MALFGPSVAGAELTVERQFSYEMPAGFSPYTAQIEGSEGGAFLMVETRGEGEQEECVAILSDEEGSRVYAYRHEFYPTRCLGGVLDGAGGVFLRGERTDVESGVLSGFTAHIAAGGELIWALEDRRLLMGELDYEGEYVAPLAGLAYDRGRQELVGLSLGERPLLEGTRERTQAHRIDVSRGLYVEAGIVFGTQVRDVILDVVAVEEGVLFHVLDGRTGEAVFYRVSGDEAREQVQPGGEEWGGRELLAPPRYDGNGGLWVLYEEQGERMLLGVRGEEVIWREVLPEGERLDEEEPPGEENPSIGRPTEFWIGEELIVVGYENDVRERFLMVFRGEDGEVVRMKRSALLWEELLALVPGGEGGMRALGFDVSDLRFGEYDVFWREGEELQEDRDEEPGQGEDGEGEPGGCHQSGQSGGSGMGLMVMVGLSLWRGRRRSGEAGAGR